MSDGELFGAVQRYARVTVGADETALARPWAWGDYDSEGVRFSFFRTYEELRELGVRIAVARIAEGHVPSGTQRILAHYHTAYRELQATILGLNEDDLLRAPALEEWSVRRILAHIAEADAGFYAGIRYALDGQRSQDGRPAKIPPEAWDGLIGVDEATLQSILEGPVSGLQQFHRGLHERILGEFSDMSDTELELPTRYWETQPMSLRFRLHRFDSHMRQHSVQVEKTLVAISQTPSEAQRLLRLIYSALGEAEGASLGAPQFGDALSEPVAASILSRARDVEAILQ